MNFIVDSPPHEINAPTKPSLKSLYQEMGFTDKSPEYPACTNFLEAKSPKIKGKQTNEVIDLISSDESPNKMEILFIEDKKGSMEANSNPNNNAIQEEQEKAEDDNNNQNVENPKK